MKEYKVIEHYEVEEFAKLVSNALAECWILCGGVDFTLTNVGPGTYHKHYAQAMTRDFDKVELSQLPVGGSDDKKEFREKDKVQDSDSE